MPRELAYLSHEITDIEMCTNCHHMTIAHIEITAMNNHGVCAPVTIRRMCEECHPGNKEDT